jgi:hypothetical protein
MPALGIIIVHHHGINTQFNQVGLFDFQAPDKQSLQQSAEKKNPRPGKGIEKTLHLVRGSHLVYIRLNTAGISLIFGQLIKIVQVPAGTIEHKAQDLFKKLENIGALPVLTDRSEESVQPIKNFNMIQIRDEQAQPGPTGQSVGGGFNSADFQFLFSVVFVNFIHRVLHLLGLAILVIALVGFNKDYSILPLKWGTFFCKNRSI